jgi:predicted GNAT family N-acyltransferase
VDNQALLDKAFQIREEVFIVEQNVKKEEEFDEFEDESNHFVVLDNEENPIGAARWRETEKGIKLERFVVKKSERGKGVGNALVKFVLDDIEKIKGTGNYLYLHAQENVVPLYQKFDFQVKGDKFDECNIWHYYMFKEN